MINELFTAIDNKDVQGFTALLAPDCSFRFGNFAPVCGIENIADFVAGFFASISALSHDIVAHWSVDGGKVCHGTVCYTRLDGSELTIPFANVMMTDGSGISEYMIFADTSALWPKV